MAANVTWSFTTAGGAHLPVLDLDAVDAPAVASDSRSQPGRAGREIPLRHQRLHQGHPLLQGPGQHRHACRHVVDRPAAQRSPARPSQTKPRPAGSRSCSRRRWPITANTMYVASYYAPSGSYAVDRQLHSPAAASTTASCTLAEHRPTGGNGVYAYAFGNAFPLEQLQNSSNYWVDVRVRRHSRPRARSPRRRRSRSPVRPAPRPSPPPPTHCSVGGTASDNVGVTRSTWTQRPRRLAASPTAPPSGRCPACALAPGATSSP